MCAAAATADLVGVGDVTVDSAADESCRPRSQGGAFEAKPFKKYIVLKTASGGEMGHYGEKEVTSRSNANGEIIGLRFQVADVKNPLLAVRRLVERRGKETRERRIKERTRRSRWR